MKFIKILYYRLLEIICNFLKLDCMKITIKRYRLNGAIIGNNVRAFSPITSSEPYLITVNDNVTISNKVVFLTHDNSIIKVANDATDLVGAIVIGKNTFIGYGVIICPGVVIADNCIIGAGSIVTKSFMNECSVIAGNPAKIISTTESFRKKYLTYAFDFKSKKRKMEILGNPEKILRK